MVQQAGLCGDSQWPTPLWNPLHFAVTKTLWISGDDFYNWRLLYGTGNSPNPGSSAQGLGYGAVNSRDLVSKKVEAED